MYIFKNDSGVELTVSEFLEVIESDLLPELITLVAHLDSPELLSSIFDMGAFDDDEEVNRLFRRFIGD